MVQWILILAEKICSSKFHTWFSSYQNLEELDGLSSLCKRSPPKFPAGTIKKMKEQMDSDDFISKSELKGQAMFSNVWL